MAAVQVSPQLQRLFAWAEQEGALWPKLAYPVRFEPGYIGSQATADIGPNEAIVTVPQKLLLTSNLMHEGELREVVVNHPELFGPQHPWHEDLSLIACLFYEKGKGENSFWAPFIAALPQECDSVLVWSEGELAELQDEILAVEVWNRRAELETHWKQFSEALLTYPHLFPQELLSLEQFTWAHWIVNSRSFGTKVPGLALGPIAELLNHSFVSTYYTYGSATLLQPCPLPPHDRDEFLRDAQLSIPVSYELLILAAKVTQSLPGDVYTSLSHTARELDAERFTQMQTAAWQKAEVEAKEDAVLRIVTGPEQTYKRGEEVYLNYGPYSNRQLLIYYGFALPQDPYAYEYIVVPLASILDDAKLKYLSSFQKSEKWGFKVKKGELCLSLLRTLRAVLWQGNNTAACFRPVDLNLELRVLARAVALLQEAFLRFPTTAELDKVLAERSLRMSFAVQYRMQRKQVLSTQIQLLSLLEAHIASLQSNSSPSCLPANLQPYLAEL